MGLSHRLVAATFDILKVEGLMYVIFIMKYHMLYVCSKLLSMVLMIYVGQKWVIFIFENCFCSSLSFLCRKWNLNMYDVCSKTFLKTSISHLPSRCTYINDKLFLKTSKVFLGLKKNLSRFSVNSIHFYIHPKSKCRSDDK